MEYNNLSIIVKKNIKKYRLLKHYTAQQLADIADLSHGYIRELESLLSKSSPSLDAISRISSALDVDVKLLFDENI